MEDFGFDIDGILSEEEAEKLFEEQNQDQGLIKEPEPDKQTEFAEEKDPKGADPEGVGEEEIEKGAVQSKGGGSSPSIYSSIAKALKKDGIFPDFEDSELDAAGTPEGFAELFEKAITARMDERTRRIDSALGNGADPTEIQKYEATIQYLDSITDDMVKAEGENGENVRRQLIWNDLMLRGYSEEKARKVMEKSFKDGDDVDDARDALDALTSYYQKGYKKLQDDAKQKAEAAREAQKQQAEKFRKSIIEDDMKLGDIEIDKRTREKIYDAVAKPTYKDPKTGRLLTAVQKFQADNPEEFIKQLGMWYVLTNGGKDVSSLIKGKVRSEKNKGIRELERKINSTSLNSDGSLKLVSGNGDGITNDILLSDDWSIG